MKIPSTSKHTRLALLGSVLVILSACDAKSSAPNDPAPTFPDHPMPIAPSEIGEAELEPSQEAEDAGKVARRLSVDQLRRSIPALFGGITWTVRQGQRDVIGFDALARALGEADYIQTSASNLDPSPLFAKFMDDMAGDVCAKAVAHDRAAATPRNDRVLIRRDDPDANLRFLRLKLHGLLVPMSSRAGIEDLRILYDEILAETRSEDEAWTGVCVAMLTAPEFMAY